MCPPLPGFVLISNVRKLFRKIFINLVHSFPSVLFGFDEIKTTDVLGYRECEEEGAVTGK